MLSAAEAVCLSESVVDVDRVEPAVDGLDASRFKPVGPRRGLPVDASVSNSKVELAAPLVALCVGRRKPEVLAAGDAVVDLLTGGLPALFVSEDAVAAAALLFLATTRGLLALLLLLFSNDDLDAEDASDDLLATAVLSALVLLLLLVTDDGRGILDFLGVLIFAAMSRDGDNVNRQSRLPVS